MRSEDDGWVMCQMLSAPEHDVGGNRRLVGHHPNHVAVDAEILAVDGGLSAQAYRPIIEDCELGPQRQRRSRPSDGVLCSQVHGVAVDGLGTRDHHADIGKLLCFEEVRGAQVVVANVYLGVNRCGVDIDAAENRLGVRDLAITAELCETPLDRREAHIDLALNPIVDRCGSMFQTPTDTGLLRSSCVLAMSPPNESVTPAVGRSRPDRSTRRYD